MLTEFFADWFSESKRWTDSTIKVAANESDANKKLIDSWLAKWQPQVMAAANLIAEFVFTDTSEDVMQQIQTELDARSKKIGINA